MAVVTRSFESPCAKRNPMGNVVDIASKGLVALPDALTPNVNELKCERNRISDIKPLSRLRELKVLSASYNAIDSLASLADLRSLTNLDVSLNLLEDAALEPLAGLIHLTELRCEGNMISDLTSVSRLSRLEVLWCGCNRISTLDPLRGLVALQELAIARNDVSSLAPIEGLRRLTSLSCEFNPLTVDKVISIASLRTLRCSQDQGNIARVRTAMPVLKVQVMERRSETLETYAESKTINLAEKSLQDVPLLPWASKSIDLSSNRISSLVLLGNLRSLTNLDVSNNSISHLAPLVRLDALMHLSCAANPIISIAPLMRLTNLKELEVSPDVPHVGSLISDWPLLAICFAPITAVVTGATKAGKSALLRRHQTGSFLPNTPLDRSQALILPIYLPGNVGLGVKLHATEVSMSLNNVPPPRAPQRPAALVICCFDCTSATLPFPSLAQELHIRSAGSAATVRVVVATKTDLVNQRRISAAAGQEFAESVNAIYMEASAATGDDVQELFTLVARAIIERAFAGRIAKRVAQLPPSTPRTPRAERLPPMDPALMSPVSREGAAAQTAPKDVKAGGETEKQTAKGNTVVSVRSEADERTAALAAQQKARDDAERKQNARKVPPIPPPPGSLPPPAPVFVPSPSSSPSPQSIESPPVKAADGVASTPPASSSVPSASVTPVPLTPPPASLSALSLSSAASHTPLTIAQSSVSLAPAISTPAPVPSIAESTSASPLPSASPSVAVPLVAPSADSIAPQPLAEETEPVELPRKPTEEISKFGQQLPPQQASSEASVVDTKARPLWRLPFVIVPVIVAIAMVMNRNGRWIQIWANLKRAFNLA